MINEETGFINFNNINNIAIENERSFWHKFSLIGVITAPISCPLCNWTAINLYNNDSINNAVLANVVWANVEKLFFYGE